MTAKPKTKLTKVPELDEANRRIPLLARIVSDLREEAPRFAKLSKELAALEKMESPPKERLAELQWELQLSQGKVTSYLEELEALGATLHDAERGSLDMDGFWRGTPVLFCWSPADGNQIRYGRRASEIDYDKRVPLSRLR